VIDSGGTESPGEHLDGCSTRKHRAPDLFHYICQSGRLVLPAAWQPHQSEAGLR